MAKKSKLLAAIDAHKGRDYEAEKRTKKRKAAEKKKASKQETQDPEQDELVEEDKSLKEVNDEELISPGTNGQLDIAPFEAFSDDELPDAPTAEPEDPENDDPPSEAEAEDEDEQDSDVALSDLSEEEREDTIPHQRLTINNTAALTTSTKRIAVTHPTMKFSAHNSLILTSLPPASTAIPDPNDDLTRELEFYRICKTGALEAQKKLKREKTPFTRPADYFAEMVKSDEHMGKIRKKLYDDAAGKKAAEEARRVRDAKKFGKAVQVAKEQERAREKKTTLEKISTLKRKRKGQESSTVHEPDSLFESIDIEQPSAKRQLRGGSSTRGPSSRGSSSSRGGPSSRGGSSRRDQKDSKFGFGGKKRHTKSGDAVSTGDMSGFSARRMKGLDGAGGRGGRGGGRGGARGGARGGGRGGSSGRGGKPRLGKSRRPASTGW